MNTPYDDSKKVFQIFESYTFLKPKNDETSILVSRDQNLLAQTCIYYLMVARVIVSKKAFNFIAHRHSYRPLFQLNDLIKAWKFGQPKLSKFINKTLLKEVHLH